MKQRTWLWGIAIRQSFHEEFAQSKQNVQEVKG